MLTSGSGAVPDILDEGGAGAKDYLIYYYIAYIQGETHTSPLELRWNVNMPPGLRHFSIYT